MTPCLRRRADGCTALRYVQARGGNGLLYILLMCGREFGRFGRKLLSTLDFHTHNLLAPAGEAVINLPEAALRDPNGFKPRPGALYSAGVHPWWTDAADVEVLLAGTEAWLAHRQVVAVGECGIDLLRGAAVERQEAVLVRQIEMAERLGLPVTLHVVRAFDRVLRLHKRLKPTMPWTVHGFRGGPALARQLLAAGLNLSFGERYNAESFALTPADRRFRESD